MKFIFQNPVLIDFQWRPPFNESELKYIKNLF